MLFSIFFHAFRVHSSLDPLPEYFKGGRGCFPGGDDHHVPTRRQPNEAHGLLDSPLGTISDHGAPDTLSGDDTEPGCRLVVWGGDHEEAAEPAPSSQLEYSLEVAVCTESPFGVTRRGAAGLCPGGASMWRARLGSASWNESRACACDGACWVDRSASSGDSYEDEVRKGYERAWAMSKPRQRP